jgi:cytochrome c oxidase assembly protein subunit 15
MQAVVGIGTLMMQVPIFMALAHQAMAVLVLTVAVLHAERLRHRVERRALVTA